MKVPQIGVAEKLLIEAEKLNPGPWISHNRVAGLCAKTIASQCDDLDENTAYVLGLLHDIGRRNGAMDMRHILCGYHDMLLYGYDDSARICLTHSFPYKDVAAYNGENDCSDKDTRFIQEYLNNVKYNDYDRLIQLCDAISFPSGPTYIEKRFVDVVLKRGFSEVTVPKWQAFLEIKQYFDNKIKGDIYKLLQI